MNKYNLVKFAIFFPLVYVLCFFLLFTASFLVFSSNTYVDPNIMDTFLPLFFFVLVPLHLIAFLSVAASFIYCLVDISKNPRVPQENKVLWVILILLFGNLALPFYWYKFINIDTAPQNQQA